jgi:hypothetical protein
VVVHPSRQIHRAASIGGLFAIAIFRTAHSDDSGFDADRNWAARRRNVCMLDCSKSIHPPSQGIELLRWRSCGCDGTSQQIKENMGGTHDECWASVSICRRVVLSLVRRDRVGLFCRQVAIRLLRGALNEPWIKFTSNAMRLGELMALMDEFPRMFEIVEPKRTAVS